MDGSTFLVFGDLHGRVLPAFRLATVWAREHGTRITGILQVGDLGYFPDPGKLDKATKRYVEDDPLELGVQDVIHPNELADQVFDDPDCPEGMWFTAGNHEDFEALAMLSGASGRASDFAIDAYGRVRCIKNGEILKLAEDLSIGALWGVDGDGRNCRRSLPTGACISQRKADLLLSNPFDVLLTHDAPAGAKRSQYGSEVLAALIQITRPSFAFFGHYKGAGSRIEGFGPTALFHLAGMELRGPGGSAEEGCVGVLTWSSEARLFEFVDPAWLKTFTRHNWKWR
jgi:Calcineurin-like phosphoesterase